MTRKLLISCGVVAVAVLLGASIVPTAGAVTARTGISYDIDSPPSAPGLNALDLYTPDGAKAGDGRPVVVFVHGGGWRIGDKGHEITDKVNLFTGAGYVFASVNYRLSPQNTATLDPARMKFPAHPHDVGEAIGWLAGHVAQYGGDPTRILLVGHSAGAHLVSLVTTDRRYAEVYGVKPYALIGTVSLDTAAFDIATRADLSGPDPDIYWNAFGTPSENAATGAWAAGSPIRFADPGDPRLLLVTSFNPNRVAENRAMAVALGQDPAGVFSAPYDHEGINDAVGAAGDTSGETTAIMNFLAAQVTAAAPPQKPKLSRHPRERITTPKRRVKVKFRFSASGARAYECRLDKKVFRPCGQRVSYFARTGRHRFRVRALSGTGRPGVEGSFRFRIVRGP